MVNSQKIKARMVELGFTQEQVAEKIGIAVSSFNLKVNNTSQRQFNITEVQELMRVLKIEDPKDYFFAS